MKRFLVACALVLSLTGCAGTPLGDALRAVTATYANPLGATDIYRVQNLYAAALELVAQYRVYCWSKPYAAILQDPVMKPTCERRRAVVRAAQSARRNARKAIDAAEQFITNNPTLNAATAVQAAWDAVGAFRQAVPQ